jgi:hypothetical protein
MEAEMKFFVSIFIVLAAIFAAPAQVTANGEAPLIESFDDARSVCGFSFVEGSSYTVARALLAAHGYDFGEGVSEVSAQALQGVDIFVINALARGPVALAPGLRRSGRS